MESIWSTKIASRGWHVYGKSTWKTPKIGQILYAAKESGQIALTIDRYSVAWMMKNRSKLTADVVGHIPKEISRAVWFFLEKGGKVQGKVHEERYRPSPIPKGGLEIILSASFIISDENRRFLDRLKNIVMANYDHMLPGVESHEITQVGANFLRDTVEQVDSDEDVVEDDEEEENNNDDVICLDD